MTKTKDSGLKPGFHIFGWVTQNAHDYKDPNYAKWITGEKYMFKMPSDFKEHAHVKRWCEENCKDAVAYEMVRSGYTLSDKIYFFLEADAIAFKLRWL